MTTTSTSAPSGRRPLPYPLRTLRLHLAERDNAPTSRRS